MRMVWPCIMQSYCAALQVAYQALACIVAMKLGRAEVAQGGLYVYVSVGSPAWHRS